MKTCATYPLLVRVKPGHVEWIATSCQEYNQGLADMHCGCRGDFHLTDKGRAVLDGK